MSTLSDTNASKNFTHKDMMESLWSAQEGLISRYDLFTNSASFGKWAIEMLDGAKLPKKHFLFIGQKADVVPTDKVTFKNAVTGEPIETGKEVRFTASWRLQAEKLAAYQKAVKGLFNGLKTWESYWVVASLLKWGILTESDVKDYAPHCGNPDKLSYALKNFKAMSPAQLEVSYIKAHGDNQPVKTAKKSTKNGKIQPVETETLTAIGVAIANSETVKA